MHTTYVAFQCFSLWGSHWLYPLHPVRQKDPKYALKNWKARLLVLLGRIEFEAQDESFLDAINTFLETHLLIHLELMAASLLLHWDIRWRIRVDIRVNQKLAVPQVVIVLHIGSLMLPAYCTQLTGLPTWLMMKPLTHFIFTVLSGSL